ncbi:hypothetical protein BLNAU_2437 [Blattamonas nauphoetae]|uniref:Uncharacterized protein n=1 Tax=Blattamonas nauphoetae TaxID=2049346 RepID=A0ABQ9YFU8_9EUKA|nr:hypothetical protein BLNAU_2437 [Blattamonas nauphoetae]
MSKELTDVEITTLRAINLSNDRECRSFLIAHRHFVNGLNNKNTTDEELERLAEQFKLTCARSQTVLEQSFLIREAQSRDIQIFRQKTIEIEEETKKRKEGLILLESELERARQDADRINSLEPFINSTLKYPDQPTLKQDIGRMEEQLKNVKLRAEANERMFDHWREQANDLNSLLSKMDAEKSSD